MRHIETDSRTYCAMKPAKEALYKRKDSDYWYYESTDPLTGKRSRISTHEKSYRKACEVYRKSFLETEGNYALPSSRLISIVSMYIDIETNPRRKQCLIDGRAYGDDHAHRTSSNARYLKSLFERRLPILGRKKISELTRLECKKVKELIVEEKGHCRQAQAIFQTFKVITAQSFDDGLMQADPAVGLSNITYNAKERPSFPAPLLSQLIGKRNAFPSDEVWAFFTILATTGMRRSELLALSTDQIFGSTMTIDRAVKSSDPDEIGEPKWGRSRVIPMSKLTQEALAAVHPDADGRYFHRSRYWVNGIFKTIKATAIALFPEDKEEYLKLIPHSLRHSLNTNLLCAGASEMLTAEYLSWHHQELLSMQQRYTHLYSTSLQPIADLIDKLYEPPKAIPSAHMSDCV